LKAGEAVKFRYSGQTEQGKRSNKARFGILTASEYIVDLLKRSPTSFLEAYKGKSEDVYEFLRASIADWSKNDMDGFSSWYLNNANVSREVGSFIQSGLAMVFEESDGKVSLKETQSFSSKSLPKDMPLSEEVRAIIDENSARIDADNGDSGFKYGIMTDVSPGWKGATTFKLATTDHRGHRSSWYSLDDECVSNDTRNTHEVVPISMMEVIGVLKSEIDSYETLITKGGFEGALEARKQYLLQQLASRLEGSDSHEERLGVMKSDHRIFAPETGVFAMYEEGLPRGQEPVPFAMRADPSFSEERVGKLVSELHINNQGRKRSYEAIGVPEKALGYVGKTKTLVALIK